MSVTATAPVRWKRGRWREEIPGSAFRWLLAPAWCFHRPAIAIRNLLYDFGWLPALRLNVPILSVGNLAAGGTGKTPVTRFLAESLAKRGETPAVLMRGYRSMSGSANDEAQMLGDLPVICDADRVAGGHRAIANGATCLIMDDGFQHRRLHRDVDLVLIDATRPWSGILPLGYDREPRSALRRAHGIVITRGELLSEPERSKLRNALAVWNKPLIELSAPETWLTDLSGTNRQSVAALRARPVLLASGLGNPQGFEGTAQQCGWQIIERWRYPDHHHFDQDDATELLVQTLHLGATLVVTAKDAVKLAPLLAVEAAALPPGTIQVLHQSVTVSESDRPVLEGLIDEAIKRQRASRASKC